MIKTTSEWVRLPTVPCGGKKRKCTRTVNDYVRDSGTAIRESFKMFCVLHPACIVCHLCSYRREGWLRGAGSPGRHWHHNPAYSLTLPTKPNMEHKKWPIQCGFGDFLLIKNFSVEYIHPRDFYPGALKAGSYPSELCSLVSLRASEVFRGSSSIRPH